MQNVHHLLDVWSSWSLIAQVVAALAASVVAICLGALCDHLCSKRWVSQSNKRNALYSIWLAYEGLFVPDAPKKRKGGEGEQQPPSKGGELPWFI